MFDELEKYEQNDNFFFTPTDDLEEVCNAPTEKSGVYVVYALKNGRIDLVYIGHSGNKQTDGTVLINTTGLGGIKDNIVNGHHFGNIPRRTSWPNQMKTEKIEALDIYWYVTHNDEYADCPGILEKALLKKYRDIHGELPKWNKVE